jgi:O-methyltransferase involved in polyketide biosynthesis
MSAHPRSTLCENQLAHLALGHPAAGTENWTMSMCFSISELSVPARTTLIPLVARAQARTLFPELGFVDEQAENMVEALGIPLDSFGMDLSWLRGTILRAKWFDDRCRQFFKANSRGMGVALGSGLDTRFQRLNEGTIRWVDLDLPEVTDLKCHFVKTTKHYHVLACDVTDPAWIDQISWRAGMPLIIVAEALLMYLDPRDARSLFREIAARFSCGGAPVSFLFDYASPLLVLNSRLHPALIHTDARFHCGLAGADAIRLLDPRYEVIEDYDISQDCGYPTFFVSFLHRLMTMGRPFYGLAHVQLHRH